MTKCFRGQSKSNLTVVLPCLLSGSEISINMAVTDNLDHDALLGRNFRNIRELIHQATAADPQDILDVLTRAQTQTEAQQDLADQDDQDQDGLEPNPLEDLLGPDYNFPRTNMSHQTDPDSDTHSSGEADMQQNNAANLIQDQRAALEISQQGRFTIHDQQRSVDAQDQRQTWRTLYPGHCATITTTRSTEAGSFSSSSWTYRSLQGQVQGPKEFLLAWHRKRDNTILQILQKMSNDCQEDQ